MYLIETSRQEDFGEDVRYYGEIGTGYKITGSVTLRDARRWADAREARAFAKRLLEVRKYRRAVVVAAPK